MYSVTSRRDDGSPTQLISVPENLYLHFSYIHTWYGTGTFQRHANNVRLMDVTGSEASIDNVIDDIIADGSVGDAIIS
jgi:hypothetical protein